MGTAFQYRNTGDADLTFICVSMPPLFSGSSYHIALIFDSDGICGGLTHEFGG